MRSNKKHPDNTDREVRVMRSVGPNQAQDPASQQLSRVSGKMGNDQFKEQLGQSANIRDGLLAFISERLKTLRGVQIKELLEMRDQRQWYKEVARGAPGYHLPDTTRYHETARLYRRAAESLANGDVSRGAQLMERAMEAERAAYKSIPKQVDEELNKSERSAPQTPDEMTRALHLSPAAAIALPSDIKLNADRIIGLREGMDVPPVPIGRHWWEEEGVEEEEEEEADDD
ncbi:MAG: hypothetical protein AAFV53_13175 [Myxococcota bacterium]